MNGEIGMQQIKALEAVSAVLNKIKSARGRYTSILAIFAFLMTAIHPLPARTNHAASATRPPMQVIAENGGPAKAQATQDEIERQPRFLYSVSKDCTLACLAKHLNLPVTRLMTYNKGSYFTNDHVPAGTQLIIPIRFPLHPDMTVLKVDIREHRYVAAYGFPVSFSQVAEIQAWYEKQLLAYGYEIISGQNNGALHFAGGWVTRGTVEFSPGDDAHPTLIDVALVIDENFGSHRH